MSPLTIGIDGYNLAMPSGTGIATYGHTLARTLKDGGHSITGVYGLDAGSDAGLREVLFFEQLGAGEREMNRKQRRREARWLSRRSAWPFCSATAVDIPMTPRVERDALAQRFPPFDRVVTSRRLFDLAHRHFRIYGRLLPVRMQAPPDVMHWTYPLPLRVVGSRNIYTLHDIVPLKLPYTTLDAKTFYRRLATACIDHGDHICTVSETSKSDIVNEFGIDPNRISNLYQASIIPAEVLDCDPTTNDAIVESTFGLPPRGYFLYFGATEPKKNIGRLLEAYLSMGTKTPLVMVGGRSWQSDGELALLAKSEDMDSEHGRSLLERVIRMGHLSRPLLCRLIRSAKAVVFPSIYEGFGLPVLEAMMLGTPVLTSDRSSLPEIAGDAALLVDPYDTPAIAKGLHALDTQQDLRLRLAQAGPRQAERFSQAHYLAALENMYAGVLTGRC